MARRTREAFIWTVGILRKRGIPFQIQGGFAARIYGSRRPLADIDIGIPDSRLSEILPDVRSHIIYGPKRYVDGSFDLLLMTLKYKGQEIDVFGATNGKLFELKSGKWVNVKFKLEDSTMKSVYGLKVPVIGKKGLIQYKKKLQRDVDVEDVRQLEKIRIPFFTAAQ